MTTEQSPADFMPVRRSDVRLTGVLLCLWGGRWLLGALVYAARLESLLAHPPPSVYGNVGPYLGALAAAGRLVLGVLTLICGWGVWRGSSLARKRLTVLTELIIAYHLLLVILPALPELWLSGHPHTLVLLFNNSTALLTCLGSLGEIIGAAALLVFARQTGLIQVQDDGLPALPRGTTAVSGLAVWLLMAREGPPVGTFPFDLAVARTALHGSQLPPWSLLVLLLSLLTAAGTVLALGAWLVRLRTAARLLAAATLVLGVAHALASLNSPIWTSLASGASNQLTLVGLLGTTLAIVVEYAMLLWALECRDHYT